MAFIGGARDRKGKYPQKDTSSCGSVHSDSCFLLLSFDLVADLFVSFLFPFILSPPSPLHPLPLGGAVVPHQLLAPLPSASGGASHVPGVSVSSQQQVEEHGAQKPALRMDVGYDNALSDHDDGALPSHQTLVRKLSAANERARVHSSQRNSRFSGAGRAHWELSLTADMRW